MPLDIKSAVILKDTATAKYAFLPMDEKSIAEFDKDNTNYYAGKFGWLDFKNKYGIAPDKAVMHGDVTDVTSNDISHYIDNVGVQEDNKLAFTKSWKCFCGTRHGLDYRTQVLERTALLSWKCLITYCGNPKYGILLNLKDYEKFL